MITRLAILNKLADGVFHSGELLALELGISRAAVWKQVKKLGDMGLVIDSIRGKGYRLQHALDLLNIEQIEAGLPETTKARVSRMDLFAEVDSTNRYLMEQSGQSNGAHICLAEAQNNGRGRRGRAWVSPFASNVYMSIRWQYATGPMPLSGLSLALGVAVMRVLSGYTEEGVGLKWPNDIFANGKKLAGILVEFSGDVSGPCQVVVGLGLNVRMPAPSSKEIDQPWIDLYSLIGDKCPERNELVAKLITQMVEVLNQYPDNGFEPYHQEWDKWDVIRGLPVNINFPNHTKEGVVKGVNTDGALVLETVSGLEVLNSGEVSLRIKS